MPRKIKIPINLNLNVRGLKKSATLAINEQCSQLEKEGKEIFRLGFGQSPFPIPQPVVDALIENAHQKDYLAVKGLYELRTAISSGLSKWCGAGGWRLGMFTFPPELRWILDAVAAVASETYTSTSTPIQYAAITAFEEHPIIDKQLKLSRRILRVIGSYLHTRLKKLAIYTPKPQGGFYLFPDFSSYQEQLKTRGIHNSGDLCKQLLADRGVALLPSFDFGRPSEELTARLSYVDFDGGEALEIAAKNYGEKPLDTKFIIQCCPKIIEAMDRVEQWLK